MKVYAQKQSQPQQQSSPHLSRSSVRPLAASHVVHPLMHLQRTIGNQAVLPMLQTQAEELAVGSTSRAASGFAHDFSRIPLHSNSPVTIQAKLTENTLGDIYEQEADRIADQVIATPAYTAVSSTPPRIQRFSGHSNGQMEAVPASVNQAPANPGGPLEPALRQDMEQRFGHDFSQVRVHTDAKAAESARAVNALAYTIMNNIVFGAGQYVPGTREGRRLLAHELVHVTQQEAASHGVGHFQKKDEGKPAPPPPPTIPPCVPKFKSLKAAITSSIGAREVNGVCELILGTPGKANGVTFTSKVDIPAGCTGTLQYVQLVDTCRSFHLFSGKDFRRKTGGDWIDKQDPIDQQQVSSSGPVEFSTNDSPGQPVDGSVERIKLKDSFKMWLMWKPDQPANADRVPLAMATWKWSAEAKVKKPDEKDCAKRWVVTQQNSEGGIGKATKNSPAATKTITQADPSIEEGKC